MLPPSSLPPFATRRAWGSAASEGSAGAGFGWMLRSNRSPGASSLELSGDGRRSAKLARLEAALFVAEGALSARKLTQAAALVDAREATALVDELNTAYDRDRTAFRVERVAAGFQLLTRPRYAIWLDRAHHRQERLKLSASALETLAIIAHRQPCTRADVEAVRGVQCSEIIKQLMERNLVRVAGEDDSLGRPYLYGTTRLFLESFGLAKLEDLPLAENLQRAPQKPAASGEDGGAEDDPAESQAA